MRIQSGSIVVGVDGSPHADRALQWAARQAVAEHRPLTLVHAIHAVNPSFVDAAIVDAGTAKSVLDVAGRKVLDDARSSIEWALPELDIHEVFDLADPRAVLLQHSEDAAMVVVGSRGRGQLRSLLLGSVSVALVRHAHCPLVVVRHDGESTVRKGVVVGVDATTEMMPVLEFAYRQASLHEMPLEVLDCVWDLRSRTTGAHWVPDTDADLGAERGALAEAMVGMQEKYPDVQVNTSVARVSPQEILAHLSERTALIVVGGHRGSRSWRTLSASVAVAVVEHATGPVAVIPVSTAP